MRKSVNKMKLYHGTSTRNLRAIRRNGLLPRRAKRKSNWANASHPLAVYLTNAFACFYANAACKGSEKLAVLEVDTDQLDDRSFGPDEDYLEQVGRGKDGIAGDIGKRTMKLRSRLFGYLGALEHPPVALSLKHVGCCTYFGNIPPDAITRVAIVDPKVTQIFSYSVFDPTIELISYKVCGPGYRNWLRWLFDFGTCELEADPVNQVKSFIERFQSITERKGITVTSLTEAVDNLRRPRISAGAKPLSTN